MSSKKKRSNSYKLLDDIDIIDRYTKGETLVKIAKSLGVAQATVSNRLKEHKIPRRKQGVRRKDINIEELVQLRSKGYSLRRIGHHFEVSYTTIRKRWQELCEQ
jgi:DNA invertase Pin-like site-specific DNA recombinase